MTMRAWLCGGGMLLLAFASLGAWTYWENVPPRDAWLINEPERIVTDFDPREKLDVSFRLCNTARVPLRILGASAC